MAQRKGIPKDTLTRVLLESARRCALCFGLEKDLSRKKGQIAHIDQNNSNNSERNLAFLCLEHHDEYDSESRLSKGITATELLRYKQQLVAIVSQSDWKLPGPTRDSQGRRLPNRAKIVAAFRNLSEPLISKSITGRQWLDRNLVPGSLLSASPDESRITCVLGEPGSGKTSYLAKLTAEEAGADNPIVAIRADLIPHDMSFESWSKQQLGLDLPLIDAIRTCIRERPILVVVDQLDAVASLVDQKTERLNDLIRFILECSRLPRVRVICSCREFEFKYDARFVTLNAHSCKLELPEWSTISAYLLEQGIPNAEAWPETFRGVLRVPQQLNVYLDHFSHSGRTDCRSYQCMLDELWSRCVRTADQQELIYRITEQLIETESLWLPSVHFENDRLTTDQLVAAGVLQRQSLQLGFRHQSLLEHAKARLFVKGKMSITEHVLRLQDAVHVRPTVWAVLGYLRAADPVKYFQEVDQLLGADIRLHIRFLLIDFLGQVSDPSPEEVIWLSEQLRHPDCGLRALIAIRGNPKWFHALRISQFPLVMGQAADTQWPMVGVLSDGWVFDREGVIALVSRHWLPDPAKDDLTFRVLQENATWDEKTAEMACTVIRRGKGERLWWAEDLVSAVSADNPNLAPRLFLATVSRPQSSQSTTEESRWYPASPLENRNEWYDLPEVADAAPVEFFSVVWPWFAERLESLHSGPTSSMLNEYGGHLLALDRDDDDIDAPILRAMEIAIGGTATRAPDVFRQSVQKIERSECRPLHRLIARGFTSAADQLAQSALHYLLSDPRRLRLGNYSSDHGDSAALIRAIVPHLQPNERRDLEDAILNWDGYRPSESKDVDHDRWNREARLRLLTAIPQEYLSEKARLIYREGLTEFPDWARTIRRGRVGSVHRVSPISEDEIGNASDETVLAAFRTPAPDRKSGWALKETPDGWEEAGGPGEAADELMKAAKHAPGRVLGLIPRLVSQGNDSEAARIIHSFADTLQVPIAEVFEAIREIVKCGGLSDELRSNLGYVLYRRCGREQQMPEDLLSTLEWWLLEDWPTRSEAVNDSAGDGNRPNDMKSVLWATGPAMFSADKSFWPLLAASDAYLSRTPPAFDRWLGLLEGILNTNTTVANWRHYCSQFRWIRLQGCDRERASKLLRSLILKYPEIATSDEFVRVFARIADLVSAELRREVLRNLQRSENFRDRQAHGELSAFLAMKESPASRPYKKLLESCSTPIKPNTKQEAVAAGIAFTASHQWDSIVRPQACDVLCRLLPNATPVVANAIGALFWSEEDFAADDLTKRLLDAVTRSTAVLKGTFIADFVAHLPSLLPQCRIEVLKACTALIYEVRREHSPFFSQLYQAGPHLVSISMTLQRFNDTRAGGLDLLESLLRVGIDDAFAVLQAVDIRPGAAIARPIRSRRRRKRPQ